MRPLAKLSYALLMVVCVSLACGSPLGPAGSTTTTSPATSASNPPDTPTAATADTATAAPNPTAADAGSLVASPVSPLRVALTWQRDDGAEGYRLEARYGSGEPFHVADLAAGEAAYEHLVTPGSAAITYLLSALAGGHPRPLGEVLISLPAFAPDPVVVTPLQALPVVVGDVSEPPPLATLDPLNPDPGALATLEAYLDGLASGSPAPDPQPVLAQADIGPEGGVVTLTGPGEAVFTLVLPAGAVAEPTTISLLGIGAILDFPLAAQPLAAVQIHPPIPFGAPLTLTIAAPGAAAVAVGQVLAGFSVSSFSSELALAPIYPTAGGAYELDVYWGDTFGLVLTDPAALAAQADRMPSDGGDQVSQQLAVLRAFNTDASPLGELRLLAQIIAGLAAQIVPPQASAEPLLAAGLAALAFRPPLITEGAQLWQAVNRADRTFSNTRQTSPGTVDEHLSMRQFTEAERAEIVTELAGKIKTFLDTHQGCRNRDDFYAQALVQLLKNPSSSFRRLLSKEYTERFGPPADLKECEYQLHIVRSEFVQRFPTDAGEDTETVVVHTNPFPLQVVTHGSRANPDTMSISLRGVGGVVYEAHTYLDARCSSQFSLTPFPEALIWITDLHPVFDADGVLVNFALTGAVQDDLAFNNAGTLDTVMEDGVCTSATFTFDGSSPQDIWGMQFPAFHNSSYNSDTWTIHSNGQSYVATSDPGKVGPHSQEETTTMVLTVNQRDAGQ